MGKHTHPTTSLISSPNRSILRKTVRVLCAFSVLSILSLCLIAFLIAHAHIKHRVMAHLSSLVIAKESLIEESLALDRQRVAVISSQREMRRLVVEPEIEALQEIDDLLEGEGIAVSGISIFAHDGRRVLELGSPIEEPREIKTFATIGMPHVSDSGWEGYTVYAPIKSAGGRLVGRLGIAYDIRQFLTSVLDVPSLGVSGEVLLGRSDEGQLTVLHEAVLPDTNRILSAGSIETHKQFGDPLALAIMRVEGVGSMRDHRGAHVFAAHRPISSLGWGLVVKIDRVEALEGVWRLALLMFQASILIMLIAFVVARVFGCRLTDPLRTLTRNVMQLDPGHTVLEKNVHTGDEVEVLEDAMVTMTTDLKRTMTDIEGVVVERTEELTEQYAKDRAILESADNGILATDADGLLQEVNPAALSMLKAGERKDLLGARIVDILRVYGEYEEMSEHPVTQVIHTHKRYQHQPGEHLNILKRDGSLFPVALSVSPVMNGDRLVGTVILLQDQTEDRKLDQIKSEFISVASHQLRTPLSSIRWYTEILETDEEQKLTESQMESLTEVKKAGERMSSLVDALLHTVKLEGKSVEVNRSEMDITTLLEQCEEQAKGASEESGVTCVFKNGSKEAKVSTDPILLQIVLHNLIDNALRYSKEGGTVEVETLVEGELLSISVKDEGIGIPKSVQDQIFNRLFRAQNAVSKQTSGSGLGLYIAKMIMDLLGGEIAYKSTEGKGTTFTLSLPVKK